MSDAQANMLNQGTEGPFGPPASPNLALRRLFMTLFLRGRGARGLQKDKAPKSVGRKLLLTLVTYAAVGCVTFTFLRTPIFALSGFLHAMTFAFLGMFVASSAGEILFNKSESDILLHRPVDPRALLWAKVRVMIEVSLWLAGAFNLAGFFAGALGTHGNWRFPFVHAVSTMLLALFCTGCVVMVYQLCLRWFGRERLEGLMTTSQVIVSVAAVMAGQILPQIAFQISTYVKLDARSWWITLLPPAWFAGIDDALAGSGAAGAWILALVALLATGTVLALAFGKLARDYQSGLQLMGETISKKPGKSAGHRWLHALVHSPPLSWLLRDPVSRASFLLTAAYLARDRDTKLRFYPGIVPILIMPVIMMLNKARRSDAHEAFDVAFVSAFISIVPTFALQLLQYSDQWQAADVFRLGPMQGPERLCAGVRQAVLWFVALPLMVVCALIVWLLTRDVTQLQLMLPGVIALPIFAVASNLAGIGVPLSLPTESAKAASRGLLMIGMMLLSMIVSGVSLLMWKSGLLWWFLAGEAVFAIAFHFAATMSLRTKRWPAVE
jgi:hypothetical protein